MDVEQGKNERAKARADYPTVSNNEFLAALTGGIDGLYHVCSFKVSPASIRPPWVGRSVQLSQLPKLSPDNNNYFSVAQLLSAGRLKENFARMFALVLDDADVNSLAVPPSYVLETSPGKHQVGYILEDTAETRDANFTSAAIKALIARKLISADRSGNSNVRYVRLPDGVNTKPRPSGPFRHRLICWEPGRRFDLASLLSEFGVEDIPTARGRTEPISELVESFGAEENFDAREAIENILTGDSFHDPLIRLAARYVVKKVPPDDIISFLFELMDMSSARSVDPDRWKARRKEVPRAVATAVKKFGHEFSDVSSIPPPLNIFPDALSTPPQWNADHYPKVISDLAQDVARRMGVDPLVPAWSAIAAVTGLIHDRHKIQVKANDTNWTESARLWVGLVGEPSTKKSPAMKEVFAPLVSIQTRWYKNYADQYEKWRGKALTAKNAGKPEPLPPKLRKVLVNDVTIEALSDILEHNAGGVLAVFDELSSWFGSMDAYRNKGVSKDRPKWLTAFNGGPEFVDRATRGPKYIPNFSVGVIGGIQPDPMRRICAKASDDDGLMQRFIMLPINDAGPGEDVEPDLAAITAWEDVCEELAIMDGHSLMRLSVAAQKIVDDTRRRLQALANNSSFGPKLKSGLSKAEAQLARLVLTFHMVENREDTNASLFLDAVPAEEVTAETASKACRLFLEVVVPSIIRFYHDVVSESPGMIDARDAAGYILANPGQHVTRRELYRAHHQFQGDEGTARLGRAMEQLDQAGWVSADGKPGERVPHRWRVNPKVYLDFSKLAVEEKTRREVVKAKIRADAEMARMTLNASKGR